MGKILHVLAAVFSLSGAAEAKDSLVIGVAQFPASLHPYISAQTVQYFTIGFALRPVSAFDAAGKRVCLIPPSLTPDLFQVGVTRQRLQSFCGEFVPSDAARVDDVVVAVEQAKREMPLAQIQPNSLDRV